MITCMRRESTVIWNVNLEKGFNPSCFRDRNITIMGMLNFNGDI